MGLVDFAEVAVDSLLLEPHCSNNSKLQYLVSASMLSYTADTRYLLFRRQRKISTER